MTLDEETKQYIHKIVSEQSIKISSLISSICNTLEEKKIFTRQDFDLILERAETLTQNAMSIGVENYSTLARILKEIENRKKELEKESLKDRENWGDMK